MNEKDNGYYITEKGKRVIKWIEAYAEYKIRRELKKAMLGKSKPYIPLSNEMRESIGKLLNKESDFNECSKHSKNNDEKS